jgi:hypothetical protein
MAESVEAIALELLRTIASNENKSLSSSMSGAASADRQWLLDTYAECLKAVKGARSAKASSQSMKV